MYIHEAIEARTERMPLISRKSWAGNAYISDMPECWVCLSNLPEGCTFVSDHGGAMREGWIPSQDDLIANDWEPVGP